MGVYRVGALTSISQYCFGTVLSVGQHSLFDFEKREESLIHGGSFEILTLLDLRFQMGDPSRGLVEGLLVLRYRFLDLGPGVAPPGRLEARSLH